MCEQRLIDANALYDTITDVASSVCHDVMAVEDVHNCIDKAPTIYAVPVVRCFECANRGDKRKCPMCFDESDEIDFYQVDNTDDDGFCHYGERKEDNHATD